MAVEVKLGKGKTTDPDFKAYTVNGYLINEPLTSNNSGFSKWGYCTKYGKTFFIKEFLSPKFPEPDAEISETRRRNQINECNEWFKERSKVYDIIMRSTGGNIVVPRDFFLFENHFYLVTDKVDTNSVKFEELHRASAEQKHVLLKVLANEFSKLAAGGIVHSDIKPNNLILKSTLNDFFTVKIIDFDDSFREEKVPYWDELHGDLAYFSPEAVLYMDTEGEEGVITTKSDVFSLGLLFHELLCGKFPEIKDVDNYTYIGEEILNGNKPLINNQISGVYRNIIEQMLCDDPNERISMKEVFVKLCSIDKTEPGVTDEKTDEKAEKESAGRTSRWQKASDMMFD